MNSVGDHQQVGAPLEPVDGLLKKSNGFLKQPAGPLKQVDDALEQRHGPLNKSEGPMRSSTIPPSLLVFRENIAYTRLRRVFDVTGALLMLAAAGPILLVAGIAILIEDGRPIFFRQRRVGRFGRLFTIYKLRTMRKDKCVDSLSPTTGEDPRITRLGYWLRKSSIDELPQLLNILLGEMAFVGPRPEMPFVVREYAAWQHLRHLVTPGVTGFWQTTCRSTVPLHMPQATLLDLDYIRRASHSTDAAVILKTIRSLLSAQGAY